MGDDKWTHRETSSISGSLVPPPVVPPVVPEERAPSWPALPRRRPKSDRRATSSADAANYESPDASPSTPPAPAGSTPVPAAPVPAAPVPAAPSPADVNGIEQCRPQLAEPEPTATAIAPQLPDNVRYLFKPVLNQPAGKPESAETGTRAETAARPERQKDRPSPAGARPSSSTGRTASAAFQRTATAPAADRLDEPDRAPDPEPARSPRPKPTPAPAQPAPTHPVPAAEPAAAEPAASVQPRRLSRPRNDSTSGPDAAADRNHLRKQLAWAAAVFLVVVTAVSTAFALVNHGPSTSQVQQASAGSQSGHQAGRPGGTGTKALAGLSRAGITRARAAQWVVREVSRSAIIACDDVMCNQLINEGLPASNVLVLGPSASDPLGADIVIGTPALRSQFGSRLGLVYAPSVLASFGRGPARIDIRVIASGGAAAFQQALTQDLEARQHYGDILLSNSQITVSPEAKPDVVSGLVDPRLLSMLPVLAQQHPIQILGFFDRAPGAGEGIPLSGVELAGSDSLSEMSAASYQKWLLGFLHSQRAPYLAVSITKSVVHGHDVVFVRFARPSPIGLLSGQ
jgi:hypothetical protein